MKMKKFIISTVLSFVLCSCTYLPTNELIRPPKIAKEQEEIYSALKNAVGNSNITFKYPQSEKYTSAITLKQLETDGRNQAIVFYKVNYGDNTRINILDDENGNWVSVFDMAGYGDEIDFLDFSKVRSSDYVNIIIGWENSMTNKKNLAIYSYNQGVLSELMSYSYDSAMLYDLNKDGVNEIVLVDYKRKGVIKLIGEVDGELDMISELSIGDDISSINNLTVGDIGDNNSSIILDEQISSNEYRTEIFALEQGELVNILQNLIDEDDEFEELMSRSTQIISKDYDGDNIIDIPTSEPLIGYEDEYEPINLTYFWNVMDGKPKTMFYAAINERQKYMIKYPTRWVDIVTVEENNITNEWSFVMYEKDELTQSVPYLRVRMYSKNDYKDKFEAESFKLIAEKGMFEYYTYIPETKGDFAITEEELSEMFVLLS